MQPDRQCVFMASKEGNVFRSSLSDKLPRFRDEVESDENLSDSTLILADDDNSPPQKPQASTARVVNSDSQHLLSQAAKHKSSKFLPKNDLYTILYCFLYNNIIL